MSAVTLLSQVGQPSLGSKLPARSYEEEPAEGSLLGVNHDETLLHSTDCA
jgi:hypothetical protein